MGNKPGPLPAKDFCNSWGDGNPILGKGALGNPNKGHMYYTVVGDRERHVKTVQMMLAELGYDVGSSGPDGKYGANTEKAVMAFQQEHKDWDGNQLKVDGLVGPETSDALNRSMVGIEGWYESYHTDTCLTVEFALLTATTNALQNQESLDVKGMKKARIVLVGALPQELLSHISLLLRSNSGSYPLMNRPYRINIEDKVLEGTTDEEGFLCHENIPPGDYSLEIEGIEGATFVPSIPLSMERRETRVNGFYLFETDDIEVPTIDEEEEIAVNQVDEENGWEDVPDE